MITAVPPSRQAVVGMASQGILLSAIQRVGNISLSLVLVRILSKEDFGAFGIASTLILFLMTFSIARFAEHSYRVPEGDDPRFDRHFGFALILHGTIAAITLATAAVAARIEAYAPASPLIAFGALGVILHAPRAIYSISLSRELNYRRLRLLGIFSLLVAASGTLTLAALGFGGIALMCQIVLAPLPYVVDMALRQPKLFRISMPHTGYRASFTFGALRSGEALLFQATRLAENLVIGAATSLATLGVYSRAYGLAQLTSGWLSLQLAAMAFPVLSKFPVGSPAYTRAAGILLRVTLWTAAPPALAISLADRAFVTIVYGARWLDTVPLLHPMLILLVATSASSALNVVALGTVGPRFVFLRQLAYSVLCFAGIPLILVFPLVVYTWYIAIVALLVLGLWFGVLMRAGVMRSADVVRAVLPVAGLAAIGLAVRLSPIEAWLDALPSPLSTLVLTIALSGVATLLLTRLVDPIGLAEVLRFVPGGIRRLTTRVLFLPTALGGGT